MSGLSGSERADEYMRTVLKAPDRFPKFVVQACERQQKDLADASLPFVFSRERADRVIRFVEMMPHVKGSQYSGKKLILSPWQCFIVATAFGWIDDDGYRRFTRAYVEVPRKCGKSTLSAALALYMLCADKEEGAEVYSAATSRAQSKVVWGIAKRMVEKCKDLQNALDVHVSAHSIYCSRLGSSFKALSKDNGGTMDGLSTHFAVIDELHAHKKADTFDSLDTSTGARAQPMLFSITTAGGDTGGICYRVRKYVESILAGAVKSDRYFGIIYAAEPEDDPLDERTWEKVIPALGVSASMEDLRQKSKRAATSAQALANFKTKHLDIWGQGDAAWMNLAAWKKCEADATEEDMIEIGARCIIAVDLATRVDILSVVKLYSTSTEQYAFAHFFAPADTVEGNDEYEEYSSQPNFTIMPGPVNDLQAIQDYIQTEAKRSNAEAILFDPWQGQQMMQTLDKLGFQVFEFRQNTQNLSPAMKELRARVLQGTIHHEDDPCLSWMMGNVVCHEDQRGNIYPRKERKELKIDSAVSLICAVGYSLMSGAGPKKGYSDEELDGYFGAPDGPQAISAFDEFV